MRTKDIKKLWDSDGFVLCNLHSKPSGALRAVLEVNKSRYSMCSAIRGRCGYGVLIFLKTTGLFTRTAYLRYHWTCLEVWRRWWNDDPYWDSASDEAAERRTAFIKHLIKKLEKHGL